MLTQRAKQYYMLCYFHPKADDPDKLEVAAIGVSKLPLQQGEIKHDLQIARVILLSILPPGSKLYAVAEAQ